MNAKHIHRYIVGWRPMMLSAPGMPSPVRPAFKCSTVSCRMDSVIYCAV